ILNNNGYFELQKAHKTETILAKNTRVWEKQNNYKFFRDCNNNPSNNKVNINNKSTFLQQNDNIFSDVSKFKKTEKFEYTTASLTQIIGKIENEKRSGKKMELSHSFIKKYLCKSSLDCFSLNYETIYYPLHQIENDSFYVLVTLIYQRKWQPQLSLEVSAIVISKANMQLIDKIELYRRDRISSEIKNSVFYLRTIEYELIDNLQGHVEYSYSTEKDLKKAIITNQKILISSDGIFYEYDSEILDYRESIIIEKTEEIKKPWQKQKS
ncbi:MAG: hypothetical protein JXR58_01520, partial [Bacteroidales bacterium]|nr:hypothetical protein [Bacteroidales bacterium]